MKFILLEANVQVSPEAKEAWRKATDKKRAEILKQVISDSGFDPDSYTNYDALRYATFQMGIDPSKNPLIDLFFDLQDAGKNIKHEYLTAIVDLYQQNRVDVSREWFRDIGEGLYDRSLEEFKYTVNILDVASDPSKLSKYFKDAELVNFDELYDDAGKIKPAGSLSTADDTSTIFGTVESWSGADGSNEVAVVKPNRKDPANIRLTKEIKTQAMAGKYGSFHEVPEAEKKDGVVIYFGAPTAKGVATAEDWVNSTDKGFYVYDAKLSRWTRVKNQ